MTKILLAALTATLMVGCSGEGVMSVDYSEQEHSVEEYLASDELSSQTLNACKASNQAEYRLMAKKPACINVREAEARKDAKSLAAFEARFQKAMKERLSKKDGRNGG